MFDLKAILEAAIHDTKRRLESRIEIRYVGANLESALQWALLNTRDEVVKNWLNGVIDEVVKAKTESEIRAAVDRLSAFLRVPASG